jgi:hypothetical protein
MRSTLSTTPAVILAAGAAAVCLAACGSTPRAVSVQAGSSSGSPAPSVSASTSPTRPAKPASERLPDSPELTVQQVLAPGFATSAGSHKVVITKSATIAQIAAAINVLPRTPHYPTMYCPMEPADGQLLLEFRDSATGPVLASVQLTPPPTWACGGAVVVTIGGVSEPSLDDAGSPGFYTHIEQLAGLSVGTPSASPSVSPSR